MLRQCRQEEFNGISLAAVECIRCRLQQTIQNYIAQARGTDIDIESSVRSIIDGVRTRGDEAILDYTERLDQLKADTVSALRISTEQRTQLAASVLPEWADALKKAADRIRRYAEKQLAQDWEFVDEVGVRLGQKISAIAAVGLYIPGGKAAYPSSILMNAIPAQVAGVERIVAMLPAPNGYLNPLLMYALELMQIDEAYTIGGAQAIAALAYGSETITPGL